MVINQPPATIPGLEEIMRLKDLGVPIAEIARRLGVSREIIYRRLRKAKAGEPQTHPAGIDNPTETKGANTNGTAVSPETEGIG
jgi:transposase-like protein